MNRLKDTIIYLSKEEVDYLKRYCDNNLVTGVIKIRQNNHNGIGYVTKVQIKDLPNTLTDITDYDSW